MVDQLSNRDPAALLAALVANGVPAEQAAEFAATMLDLPRTTARLAGPLTGLDDVLSTLAVNPKSTSRGSRAAAFAGADDNHNATVTDSDNGDPAWMNSPAGVFGDPNSGERYKAGYSTIPLPADVDAIANAARAVLDDRKSKLDDREDAERSLVGVKLARAYLSRLGDPRDSDPDMSTLHTADVPRELYRVAGPTTDAPTIPLRSSARSTH